MKKLNDLEKSYWEAYLNTLPENLRPLSAKVKAYIAGNLQNADKLLNLYLNGKKTAGSGLVKDYEAENEELPLIGEYWIILDSKQIPRCIVKTVKVEICPFNEIKEEIAIAEGEGDLSLKYWRSAHRKFFAPFLKDLKIDDIEKTLVVTEFLEVVYKDV